MTAHLQASGLHDYDVLGPGDVEGGGRKGGEGTGGKGFKSVLKCVGAHFVPCCRLALD